MTSALPAVAASGCGRPSNALTVGVASRCGWSPDHVRVSQDRDGLRQIQSRASERLLRYGMISAMPKLRFRLVTDWASDTACYASAYGSSYTVVYTKAKEVS